MSGTMMDQSGKGMEVESGVPLSDPLSEPITDPLTEEPWLDEAALKSGTLPPQLFTRLKESFPLSGEKDVPQDGRIDVDGVPVDVKDTEDAGNFFCEFVLHSLLSESEDPTNKSLVTGDDGPLVGFLHLPEDDEMLDPSLKRTQEERHEESRKVVGSALRGYFEQITLNGGLKPDEPMRIMMTGFEPWDYVKDNPSGDFVSHAENTTEAMKFAFGDRLDESKTTSKTDSDGAVTMTYTILNPPDGKPQLVEVFLRILPTANEAVDGTDGSIPDLFDDIDPHAVLSMGVAADLDPSTTTHLVETTANDKNLKKSGRPKRAKEKQSRALVGAVKVGSDKIKKDKEDRD